MEQRALVIIGATVSGIALAEKRPDALVLEEGMLLGGEFLASLNLKPDDGAPASADARGLRAECRKIDALGEDGRLYAPPIQALLAERLTQSGAEIRFQAQVLEMIPHQGGRLIRWLDGGGLHMTWARQTVDTRAADGEKGLCVMIDAAEGAPDSPAYTVLFGHLPGECVIKWRLSRETTWVQARELVHAGMARLPGRRMVAVAPIFCYDSPAPVCLPMADGLWACVSASYSHLFAAWEGGIACAAAL